MCQICGVLRTKYLNEKGKWEMIEKKAFSWIKRQCSTHQQGQGGKEGQERTIEEVNWSAVASSLANL